jgi:hypothetical protein
VFWISHKGGSLRFMFLSLNLINLVFTVNSRKMSNFGIKNLVLTFDPYRSYNINLRHLILICVKGMPFPATHLLLISRSSQFNNTSRGSRYFRRQCPNYSAPIVENRIWIPIKDQASWNKRAVKKKTLGFQFNFYLK